jgi:hypothetical protein
VCIATAKYKHENSTRQIQKKTEQQIPSAQQTRTHDDG